MKKVTVIGIGDAGRNILMKLDFFNVEAERIYLDTDIKAFKNKRRPYNQLQIGKKTAGGHGAKGDPLVGEAAAKESLEEIKALIHDTDLLMITCSLGGGTGSGAAPVIANMAMELGIYVDAVVITPDLYEPDRRKIAAEYIQKLRSYTEYLLINSNDRYLAYEWGEELTEKIWRQNQASSDCAGRIGNTCRSWMEDVEIREKRDDKVASYYKQITHIAEDTILTEDKLDLEGIARTCEHFSWDEAHVLRALVPKVRLRKHE